jgi:hypothetical protein
VLATGVQPGAAGLAPGRDDATGPRRSTDREWPVGEREQALVRLVERGILTASAAITTAGMTLHQDIEFATDRISALRPEQGVEDVDRAAELLEEPVDRLRRAGDVGVVSALRNDG